MRKRKIFCVYILASKPYGTLYVGVTAHLKFRVWQHKKRLGSGFTKQHRIHRLVYYEIHPNALSAIKREKRVKRWRRLWKVSLIQARNPKWEDLFDSVDF